MPSLVHSDEDRRAMLDALRLDSVEDLLVDIPSSLRLKGLDIEPGLSEVEVTARMRQLAGRSPYLQSVHVAAAADRIGQIVPALITAATANSL